jgi:hypothetical protein
LSTTTRTNHSAKRLEPNTIPRGMALANLGILLLLLADLATMGGLVAHTVLLAGLRDPDAQALIGRPDANIAGVLGPILGIELAFAYIIFPLQFLDGRATVAVGAYRILCSALVVGHPLLLLAAGLDLAMHGREALSFVFLSAPVSLIATPFLYPVWRVRRLRWLDLAAPPEQWEAMAGIDGPVKAAGVVPPRPSPMWLAFLLPFVASARARQYPLAVLALLLWLGAFVLLFMAPLRALVPFVMAAGVGRHAAVTSARRGEQDTIARLPRAGSRDQRLRALFTPVRLRPAPRYLSGGLLVLPLLLVLDACALIATYALNAAGSLESFTGMVEGWTIVLVVLIPFVLYALMAFVPLGTALGVTLYRAIGGILTISHLGFALLYAAITFDISLFGRDVSVSASATPMLVPLTVALLVTLPLSIVLALSLPARPVDLVKA